jgi:ABC-type transporter Mla subunit MlaD
MTRIVCVWILSTMTLAAQERAQEKPPALATLRQAAEKSAAEWDTLAGGLETRIARLLPCDPRVFSAIEEVSRASQARLTTFRQYLEAAAGAAKDDADAVQRFVGYLDTLAPELNTERAEAEQVRVAIDAQFKELSESVSRRKSLEDAQKALARLAGVVRQRVTQTEEDAGRVELLKASLAELGAQYQARQKALETEVSASASEAERWSEYYFARTARSQTECTITNAAVAPASRPAPRKKQ